MAAHHALESISCSRCQLKKIRCNRVSPQCDKCESIGAQCQYRPRKPRSKKQGNDNSDYSILTDVLSRLQRLEEHCGLEKAPETDEHADRSMSRSSVDSDIAGAVLSDHAQAPATPGVIGGILSRIKNTQNRALLLSNVFSHLRAVESCFFENENCMGAIAAAMMEIEHLQETPAKEALENPEIPHELTKKFIQTYYDFYQYEGFKMPLEKDFLLSIPDLLRNPHIQVDYVSQIIYHSLCLQSIMLNPSLHNDIGGLVRYIYQKCQTLTEYWVDHIQNTPTDLYAAILMVSMALEGCNSELAWKMLGHALTIAKVLGYFYVDGYPDEANGQPSLLQGPMTDETEVDKNRKRFEFWHLLRTDCLFRLCFGKPTLIPPGSWKVNFPDPTIDGIDKESSRFVQIHFLASMRLTIVVMKYLDWVDSGPDPNPVLHDATVDSFLAEVESIMRDWDTDELLRLAKTEFDAWFCSDMIFSSFKILIILHQSKKCEQQKHHLPPKTVEFSRKSIQMFQSLLGSALHAYSGISLILLHQFIPFFILCLDIIGNHEREEVDTDLALVTWIGDHVEAIVEERVELRPVMIIVKAMLTACHQVRTNHLASSMTGIE